MMDAFDSISHSSCFGTQSLLQMGSRMSGKASSSGLHKVIIDHQKQEFICKTRCSFRIMICELLFTSGVLAATIEPHWLQQTLMLRDFNDVKPKSDIKNEGFTHVAQIY